MLKLRKGAVQCIDQEGMEELAFSHFVQLLGSTTERGHTVNLAELDLSHEELAELGEPIMAEEVWKAIKSLPADKAPGPDGFTSQFYQVMWDIIKAEVLAAVQQFFHGDNRSFELLNEALITLLPKEEDAVDIGDYWPISLLHSFAKIIAKILAGRLAKSWVV